MDTLGVKLFLAIAGANLVLVMAVYLVYSWSFDKGLVDYVNKTEQARLTPMITQLSDGYRRHGDWQWLTEDREEGGRRLLGESLGWRLPRRGWLRGEGLRRLRVSRAAVVARGSTVAICHSAARVATWNAMA